MNKLSTLEKTQNSYYEKSPIISHHRKARTSQKHKGSPQKQIKKQLKMPSYPYFSLILKKNQNPAQILTAISHNRTNVSFHVFKKKGLLFNNQYIIET